MDGGGAAGVCNGFLLGPGLWSSVGVGRGQNQRLVSAAGCLDQAEQQLHVAELLYNKQTHEVSAEGRPQSSVLSPQLVIVEELKQPLRQVVSSLFTSLMSCSQTDEESRDL